MFYFVRLSEPEEEQIAYPCTWNIDCGKLNSGE